MERLEAGQVYTAKRTDIADIKIKIQLYFADNLILLINTNKSKSCVSVPIRQADCPLLDHDSYIELDMVFQYLPEQKILNICEVPTNVLKQIYDMLNMSTQISGIQKQQIRKIIRKIIIKRENEQ